MTDKQPGALRLADELESCGCLADEAIYDNAAAELRRLHDLNQEVIWALKDLADLYDTDEGCRSLPQYISARAAIAKATGSTQ